MSGTRLRPGRGPGPSPGTAGWGEVPDLVEPLVGWRLWHLAETPDGLRLTGLFQPAVWPAHEPFVAGCSRRRLLASHRRPHEVPSRGCQCGVYGAELDVLRPALGLRLSTPPRRADAVVLGRVSLWGTVLECPRGWRASHAYPASLHVLEPLHDLPGAPSATAAAEALEAYGVPVEPLDADGVLALVPGLDVEHDVMAQPGRWMR